MNTEKLRELRNVILAEVANGDGERVSAYDAAAWAYKIDAIIAEEEAREPVAWVSLLKNDSGQIYWMANKPLDRMPLGVYIYTQPPSAGGEK